MEIQFKFFTYTLIAFYQIAAQIGKFSGSENRSFFMSKVHVIGGFMKMFNKRKHLFYLSVLMSTVLIFGCTSTAVLNKIQTSNNYPNKLKVRALVYLSDDFKNRITPIKSSTNICAAYNGSIDVSSGYRSSIESGLNSCISEIEFVNVNPSPEMLKSKKADLTITVSIQNESFGLNCSEVSGFLTVGTRQNAQCQISFGLSYTDKDGKTLYSQTSNGSSFDTKDMGCSDIAQMMAQTMEKSLKQIADNIAQNTYGNSELRDYVKSLK